MRGKGVGVLTPKTTAELRAWRVPITTPRRLIFAIFFSSFFNIRVGLRDFFYLHSQMLVHYKTIKRTVHVRWGCRGFFAILKIPLRHSSTRLKNTRFTEAVQ